MTSATSPSLVAVFFLFQRKSGCNVKDDNEGEV
jgi:hypothetical protein